MSAPAYVAVLGTGKRLGLLRRLLDLRHTQARAQLLAASEPAVGPIRGAMTDASNVNADQMRVPRAVAVRKVRVPVLPGRRGWNYREGAPSADRRGTTMESLLDRATATRRNH